MADNPTIDNGTGTDYVVATDDDGTAQHQYVKVEFGPDNTQTKVTTTTGLPVQGTGSAGTAATGVVTVQGIASGTVLPVSDGGGSLTVDNGGTFAVQADTELTTADLDSGAGTDTRAVVGLVIAKSGGAANLSNSDPMPVSDAGGTLSVDDGAGSLTVDGTVAATQSGTWNVGTVTTVTNVVHVDDNSGNLSIDDGGNSITVDNGGTFAVQATIAAGATSIAKAEDVASADADVGVPALAVRKATPANTSGTDGDYEFLQISAGRLWASATIDAALPAGTNAIGKLSANSGVVIGDVNLAAGTNTNEVVGDVAEDAALAGNPVRIGVRASTALPTAMSTDGDIVTPWADRSGIQFVKVLRSAVKLTATPTISTSGYVANDGVGGLLTFATANLATGRGGTVTKAVLTSRTIVANALELWLGEATFTSLSADNAAIDGTDANFEAFRPFAVIDFLAADWKSTASSSYCNGTVKAGPVSEDFLLSGTSMFGFLVARTVAGQYGGTTDLIVNVYVAQD